MPKAAPKPVSKHFRFDWNYAAKATRVPAIRPATFIIAAMPILKEFAAPLGISMQNMWLLWFASLFSLGALTTFWIRCPAFVKEYQYYEQFRRRGHSHRWIVWEFFHNLHSLAGWKNIVHEAQEKHIILSSCARVDIDCFRACPIFPERSDSDSIQILPPVNIDRDIYLPIWLDGDRFILVMQESDPELDQKVKELFWILLTQAAKERLGSRVTFWILGAIAILLSTLAILNNVLRAVSDQTPFN